MLCSDNYLNFKSYSDLHCTVFVVFGVFFALFYHAVLFILLFSADNDTAKRKSQTVPLTDIQGEKEFETFPTVSSKIYCSDL